MHKNKHPCIVINSKYRSTLKRLFADEIRPKQTNFIKIYSPKLKYRLSVHHVVDLYYIYINIIYKYIYINIYTYIT